MSDNSNIRSETAKKALNGLGEMNKAARGLVDFAGDMAASITGGQNLAKQAPDVVGEAIKIGHKINHHDIKHDAEFDQQQTASGPAPNTPPNPSQGQGQGQGHTI